MNNKILLGIICLFFLISFKFPEDHSFHKDYGLEWIYFVGHLKTEKGEDFGYELSFFRLAVGQEKENARIEIFPVHFAISSVSKKMHQSFQTRQRTLGKLAGYSPEYIHSGEYEFQILGKEKFRIIAKPKFSETNIDFILTATKPPLIHGQNGISIKSRRNPNISSFYYSYPRLVTTGTLKFQNVDHKIVSGDSWMDHEWSEGSGFQTSIVRKNTSWDWLCLSADDGSDFVSFNFRASREMEPEATGILRSPSGVIIRFEKENQLSMMPLADGNWTSPKSEITYPLQWKILFPNGYWIVKPMFTEQEFDARKSTGLIYWEGMVLAEGVIDGKKRSAKGYLELKGYEKVDKWWKL